MPRFRVLKKLVVNVALEVDADNFRSSVTEFDKRLDPQKVLYLPKTGDGPEVTYDEGEEQVTVAVVEVAGDGTYLYEGERYYLQEGNTEEAEHPENRDGLVRVNQLNMEIPDS